MNNDEILIKFTKYTLKKFIDDVHLDAELLKDCGHFSYSINNCVYQSMIEQFREKQYKDDFRIMYEE